MIASTPALAAPRFFYGWIILAACFLTTMMASGTMMAIGGFLGGYLFDVSHSYVSAWLLSFGAGFISSLLALDLLTQGERTKAVQAAAAAKPERTVSAVRN